MSGALRPWALILARSPGARTYAGGGGVSYTQGQSPEPRTREYFYYVDHQGQVGGGGVFTVRQPGLPGRAGNTRTRGYGPKGLGPQRTTSRAWLRPAGFASPVLRPPPPRLIWKPWRWHPPYTQGSNSESLCGRSGTSH